MAEAFGGDIWANVKSKHQSRSRGFDAPRDGITVQVRP